MKCIKILSKGQQITIKIKRNMIRMEKLEKTEKNGIIKKVLLMDY